MKNNYIEIRIIYNKNCKPDFLKTKPNENVRKIMMEDVYLGSKNKRIRFKYENGKKEYMMITGSGYYKKKKKISKEEYEKIKKEKGTKIIIKKFIGWHKVGNEYGFVEQIQSENKKIISAEFEIEKSKAKDLMLELKQYGEVTTKNVYDII